MKVHYFHGAHETCADVTNGKTCGQDRDAAVHQHNASHGCYYPVVVVQVFTQRTPEFDWSGTHYASVAWVREDEGSWYSAWFAPHNEPGTYHRCEEFDAQNADVVGMRAIALMNDKYTEAELLEMGITNQYVPKPNRIRA